MSEARRERRLTLVLVALPCLLALALRLPLPDTPGLTTSEQRVLAASQGLDPWAPLPADAALDPAELPRGKEASPLFATALALWVRVAGPSEVALRLPSALAGTLTAAVVGAIAVVLAGPWAGGAAGLLVAVSPIHTLASREAGPGPPGVLLLAAALCLALGVARDGGRTRAVVLGVLLGTAAPASPVLLALSGLLLAWLVTRPTHHRSVALAAGSATAVLALAAAAGRLPSPLALEPGLDWVPEATLLGVVRCAGASLTRVAGLEYHLVLSHARTIAPITLLVLALACRGARRLETAERWLLAAGVALPFAMGVVLALSTGSVAPLQAHRMLPALVFLATLVGVGLASVPRRAAVLTGGLLAGVSATFLGLALEAAPRPSTPTHDLAREIARCLPDGATVSAQRPLDLYALAAWRVPGPYWLRSPEGPPPPDPEVRLGPPAACAWGATECPSLPPCSSH